MQALEMLVPSDIGLIVTLCQGLLAAQLIDEGLQVNASTIVDTG